jgi:hypothetical protein
MAKELHTPRADEAWLALRQALQLRGPFVAERKSLALTLDQRLAAFLVAAPGVLEARLLAGLAELARDQGDGDRSLLEQLLLASWKVPGNEHPLANLALPLPSFFSTVNPEFWLEFFAAAYQQHPSETEIFGLGFLREVLRRTGLQAIPAMSVPEEARDLLLHLFAGHALPDLLPEIAAGMSAAHIETILSKYTGRRADWLQKRLVRLKFAISGNKRQPQATLAERIAEDLQTLAQAKISRSRLVERLRVALDLARYERTLAASSARVADALRRGDTTPGASPDPVLAQLSQQARALREKLGAEPGLDNFFLHPWELAPRGQPKDVFDPIHPLWRHSAQEFSVTRLHVEVQIFALEAAPLWIKRFGFFGGARFRIEPDTALRVLF